MSACSILAKSQYRKRHDKFGGYMHSLLCKKYHFLSDISYTATNARRYQFMQYKWYTHTHTHTHTHTDTPQSVQGNDEYKILWDFNIQTDKVIEYRRPDIVCINKQERECQIIDFAIPGDQNIART